MPDDGKHGLEDAELVAKCRKGDSRAWEQLVDRYARLVHYVPVRHGLTPQEVDDIGQEVFIALAQNIDSIEHPERLASWLTTTARRLSWRALHKRKQEQPASASDLSEDDNTGGELLFSQMPTINDLLGDWARQEDLQAGMARLSERCRELLYRLFLDPQEPSYEEISETIGIAKGSIGPTRNRCLEQLRALIQGLHA